MHAATDAELFAIGLNHRAAPLSMRERLALPASLIRDSLVDLRDVAGVAEAAILSTCNRTEIYCMAADPHPARLWLSQLDSQRRPEEALPYIRVASNEQAACHAFKVASGLDSMVLGEPQITGQFKTAFAEARVAGTVGTVLGRLCDRSLSVAKRIRNETAISEASLSIPALAVKLARRIFPDLADISALFVGAGEMVEIGMAHFCGAPVRSAAAANRTAGKAKELAARFAAGVVPFEQVLDALPDFDLVYSCTSSSIPIFGKGALERALLKRKHRPMLLIDLAVPRDIEPEVAQLDDAFLYTVDDLGHMAAKAGKARENSLSEAETIAEIHSRQFFAWMRARPRASAVANIRQAAERIRETELDSALRQLRGGKPPEEVLGKMSRRITAKLLHPPTRLLGGKDVGDSEKETLQRLYGRAAGLDEDA